ncbi:MAG: hypothetical protein GX020_03305 [Firmicutes bacterium]|nr:hypothetical protein [Bacillota bacterium]
MPKKKQMKNKLKLPRYSLVDTKMGGPSGQLDGEDLKNLSTKPKKYRQ